MPCLVTLSWVLCALSVTRRTSLAAFLRRSAFLVSFSRFFCNSTLCKHNKQGPSRANHAPLALETYRYVCIYLLFFILPFLFLFFDYSILNHIRPPRTAVHQI
jgi:hypothetical protein